MQQKTNLSCCSKSAALVLCSRLYWKLLYQYRGKTNGFDEVFYIIYSLFWFGMFFSKENTGHVVTKLLQFILREARMAVLNFTAIYPMVVGIFQSETKSSTLLVRLRICCFTSGHAISDRHEAEVYTVIKAKDQCQVRSEYHLCSKLEHKIWWVNELCSGPVLVFSRNGIKYLWRCFHGGYF